MLRSGLSARFLKNAIGEICPPISWKAAVCERLELRTLLSAGALDTSFNKTGIASFDFGTGITAVAKDAVVQSDGKTIVAGYKYSANAHSDFVVTRFNLDGTLDKTFGPNHNGVGLYHPGDSDKDALAHAVSIDNDGKIVVAGSANNHENTFGSLGGEMAVIRLNSDGTLDNTFGKVLIDFGTFTDAGDADSIAIQSNNQIVLGGSVQQGTLNPDFHFAIARLTTTGKLDSSFDGDGTRVIDYGGTSFIQDIGFGANGTIIAIGGSSARSIVARFKSDGSDDLSFDGDGSAIDNFPGSTGTACEGGVIQGDGKIVMVGGAITGSGSYDVVMTRYNTNGHNDTTFGPNGNSWVSVGLGGNDFGYDVLRSYAGGLIVSAGNIDPVSYSLIGFTSDGKIDKTFGPNNNGIAPAKSVGQLASGPGRRFVLTGGATGSSVFSVSRYLDAGANLVGLSTGFDNTASEAGADSAIVYVTRSERLATPTTVYFTFGGTASGPGTIPASQIDYTGVPTPDPMRPFTHFVVIQPNQTIAQFTITAKDDTRAEFDETATFTILDDPGYEIGTPSTVTVNIPDNDRQISGTVFKDNNGNGKQDASDPPLSGWTVYVDKNNNKTLDAGEPSFVTNAAGGYLFAGLAAGSYSIREVLQNGFQQTLPASPGNYNVTVGPGLITDKQDFGNKPTTSSPAKLTGTIIGTTGSYNNSGNTRDKAFDGNLTTFFDAPVANKDNAWVGLDLGSAKVVNEVKYAPRPNYASRMVGGMFQASNTADFSSGVVTLFTISAAPGYGALTTQILSNTTAYRYVRYLAPVGAYGDVAEVEFWNVPQQSAPKLTGTVIGTTGSYNNGGNTRDKAFDGNTTTFFDAPVANKDNAWVGLDLGSAKHITRIRFTPRANYASRMVGGIFQGSNTADFSSGVTNLYTISSTPAAGWSDVNINVAGTFRYVRYLAPAGSYGDVAEIEFYGT